MSMSTWLVSKCFLPLCRIVYRIKCFRIFSLEDNHFFNAKHFIITFQDDCLQTTDSEETIQSQTSRNPFVEDEDFKKCPVCQKEVLNDEMNEHLDYCIEANN